MQKPCPFDISDGKGVHFCQDFRFRAAVAHKSRSNRLGKWQGSDVTKWPKSNLNLLRDFLNHWLPPALSVSIQYANIDLSWMLPVCPPEGQKFGSPTGSFALSEPLSGVELTHQNIFDQRCWAFGFETWKSFEINESEVTWAGLFGFEQRPFETKPSRRGSDEIHAALQRHCTITVDNLTSFEPWMPAVELWSCRLSDDFPAGSPVYQVEPSCQIKLLVWMTRNFYLSGSAAHAADQHWILSFGRPVRNVQISGWSQKSCFCLDDARVQQTIFFFVLYLAASLFTNPGKLQLESFHFIREVWATRLDQLSWRWVFLIIVIIVMVITCRSEFLIASNPILSLEADVKTHHFLATMNTKTWLNKIHDVFPVFFFFLPRFLE